jgi:membrane-associated PAP2 superfamily phosphatase
VLQLWWDHLRAPLAVFVVLAGTFATTRLDFTIAGALFFDPGRMQWLGAHSWWSNELLHTGGRWLIRALVLLALLPWLAPERGGLRARLQPLRRPAAYFAVSVVLSVGIVGLLKTLTHVECPWDLTYFGGRHPYVELLGAHGNVSLGATTIPGASGTGAGTFAGAALHRGHCFPAAHAGSGYALLALYFALRERSARLARLGIGCGLAIGLIFGIAQQSRGAHFVSHDVWSAFLAWTVSLSLYCFAFKGRLWRGIPLHLHGVAAHEASGAPGRLAAGGAVAVYERAGGVARASRR